MTSSSRPVSEFTAMGVGPHRHSSGSGAGTGVPAQRRRPAVSEHVPSHDDLPLPDYDHLPTGSLEGRIRSLTADQVATVRAYEEAHANRVAVLQLLDARAARLEQGAEPT